LKVENLLKTIPKAAFDTEEETREGMTKKSKAISTVKHLIASMPEVSCHVPLLEKVNKRRETFTKTKEFVEKIKKSKGNEEKISES
jgi:uncharacterized protein YutD